MHLVQYVTLEISYSTGYVEDQAARRNWEVKSSTYDKPW